MKPRPLGVVIHPPLSSLGSTGSGCHISVRLSRIIRESLGCPTEWANPRQLGGFSMVYFGLAFANFQYRADMKSRFSKVEVARPPMITMAVGCSISCPARRCSRPPTELAHKCKSFQPCHCQSKHYDLRRQSILSFRGSAINRQMPLSQLPQRVFS
jgi:hypothetical protein